MKLPINKIITLVLLLSPNYYFTLENQKVSTKEAKVLSYTITDDSNTKKVKLSLSGTDYTRGKHCRIKKENNNLEGYVDINSCMDTHNSHGTGKCVIPCESSTNLLAYNVLSPRTKYIFVFADDNPETAGGEQTKGNIFGLKIPLLVNPEVKITTSASQKLKLSTITCEQVKCPIKYKKVSYSEGNVSGDCVTAADIEVEFDLMIPFYEMQCDKYPSFFYHMPNAYMKKEIDIFKPQYYVTFKSAKNKTTYKIKFTNSFPTKICRFGIRDGTAAAASTFTYVCGDERKECYAPCDSVELTLSPSKVLVEVSIQTRHHNIKALEASYEGFKEKKFAIIEPTGGFLSNIISDGATLNASLLNPSGETQFNQCTFKHFHADKPRPSPRKGTETKCTDASATCGSSCEVSLAIKGLPEGKAIMIEIASSGINNPQNFNEYIYLRTKPKSGQLFRTTKPTVTETSSIIKAIEGNEDDNKEQVTCSYYISLATRNNFVDAECSDSYPCRGNCKEEKTFINLIPGSTYEIKVIPHKEYETKIYKNIKTSF